MKRILVVYHSQEKGNTQKMAELVAEGCREVAGVEVDMVNVNKERVSVELAESADAYAIGSPDYFSYVAGNLKQFFDDMLLAAWDGHKTVEKPFVGFLTHGGGGAALQSLDKLAKATKLVAATSSFACRGAPTEAEDQERSRDLGRALAQYVVEEQGPDTA